jgi:LPXTG-site transpeptidase (sortase) family protein
VHDADATPSDQVVRTRRGRLVLALTLFGAAVVVILLVARPPASDDLGTGAGAAAGRVRPVAFTVSTLPPLPLPDALPADPYEPTPPEVIGTIEIPRIALATDVQRGMALTAIDRGPSWWPGTAMPGELGNVVLAGHRTTHDRPFHALNELVAGDEVVFTTAAGRFVYQVRDVIVVPADWIDIAAQTYAHTATLFACHPLGSATHRIVAKLRLLDASGKPVDPDAALPPIDAEAQRTDHTLVVRSRPDATASPGIDPLGASGG